MRDGTDTSVVWLLASGHRRWWSCGWLALLAIGIFSLLIHGCATVKAPPIEVPAAAEVSLPGIKTVAVLPFESCHGSVGQELAEAISQQLHDAGYFQIVDRTHLDRVVREQGLGQTGLFEESGSSQVGKLLNADAVIVGIVSQCGHTDASQYIPSQTNPKTGHVTPGYYAIHRTFTLRGTGKVVDVKTGKLLATLPLECIDATGSMIVGGEPPSPATMQAQSVQRAAQIVVRKISPHTETLVLKFDAGKGAVAKDLKEGLRFAKEKHFDEAAREFDMVVAKYPRASAPAYNRAVIAFIQGDYDQAAKRQADAVRWLPGSLKDKSTRWNETKYNELKHRLVAALKNRERILEDQGLAKTPGGSPRHSEPKPPDDGQLVDGTKQSLSLGDDTSGGIQQLPYLSPKNRRPDGTPDVLPVQPTRDWHKQVRVAVVIPEIVIRRQVPDPAAETAILQTLLAAGFKAVEQTSISSFRYQPTVTAALRDATEAAALARKLKVDVLVIGEAFSEATPMVQGFHNFRSRVEVRVIHADSSEIVAITDATGKASDTGEFVAAKAALKNAGEKVAHDLIAKLDDYHETNDGLTAGQRARQTRSPIVTVAVERIAIRLDATTASNPVANATRDEALKVLDYVAPWYLVQSRNGREGWVHDSEVSVPDNE